MEEELIVTTEQPIRASIGDIDNCGGTNCVHLPTFWEKYGDAIQYDILLTIIIGFLITRGFYLVYKNKKDEHPWKHAIRRSWYWRIVVFLVLYIVLGALSIIY